MILRDTVHRLRVNTSIIHQTSLQAAVWFGRGVQASLANDATVEHGAAEEKPELANGFIRHAGEWVRREER